MYLAKLSLLLTIAMLGRAVLETVAAVLGSRSQFEAPTGVAILSRIRFGPIDSE